MFIAVSIITAASIFAQKGSFEISFTAVDSASWLQLDSIRVMNRTQGGDTVLYWPDTVLLLDYSVGIPADINLENDFRLFQNYPNPISDQTTIKMYIPQNEEVHLVITDIHGRKLIEKKEFLLEGMHRFCFSPPAGHVYFLSAQCGIHRQSIKMISGGEYYGKSCSLKYMGSENTGFQAKTLSSLSGFSFSLNDTLLYIGYADSLESGLLDAPLIDSIYTFGFATNIPCPGTPTVVYEGQVYNTIQIFSQCWLKENLNVGTMIPGYQEMTDDGIIEKYCYDDDTINCQVYGGLYQWNEMMDYRVNQGTRGICPEGWHIPTDEEWKVLEGSVDSYYGIGDSEWDDSYEWRGADAGKHLKATYGWPDTTGTDMFGFRAMPGGNRGYDGNFYVGGLNCPFWSSSENSSNMNWAWHRSISHLLNKISRHYNNPKGFGFSIRCLKDQ